MKNKNIKNESIPARYERNIGTVTADEIAVIRQSSVCIAGCGGLGGYIIQMLARFGVGHMTIVDDGSFEDSNLNRQVFSSESNIGRAKVSETAEALKAINSDVKVDAVCTRLDKDNAADIISGHDLVIDALDNVESRLILEDACSETGIAMIHGAISAWWGQVALIQPGSRTLHKIYNEMSENISYDNDSDKSPGSNPSFTPAVIAGLQSAEAVKYLIGRPSQLEGKMLFADLLDNSFDLMDI